MEVTLEHLNSRIVSLVQKITSCDEEKTSILLEITTLKITNSNSGEGGVLEKMCENLERFLEKLVVTIKDDTKRETKEKTTTRKCRYYNRGFCKYRESCRFYHSPVVCNTYLEEGICGKKSCSERHPKKCRYWAGSPKGCTRDDGCKYLHVKAGKYDSGESVTENQVSDCDDCQYEEGGGNDRQTYVETSHTDERPYNCDTRDLPQDNRDDLQRHRNAKYVVREDEEAYFATKG